MIVRSRSLAGVRAPPRLLHPRGRRQQGHLRVAQLQPRLGRRSGAGGGEPPPRASPSSGSARRARHRLPGPQPRCRLVEQPWPQGERPHVDAMVTSAGHGARHPHRRLRAGAVRRRARRHRRRGPCRLARRARRRDRSDGRGDGATKARAARASSPRSAPASASSPTRSGRNFRRPSSRRTRTMRASSARRSGRAISCSILPAMSRAACAAGVQHIDWVGGDTAPRQSASSPIAAPASMARSNSAINSPPSALRRDVRSASWTAPRVSSRASHAVSSPHAFPLLPSRCWRSPPASRCRIPSPIPRRRRFAAADAARQRRHRRAAGDRGARHHGA